MTAQSIRFVVVGLLAGAINVLTRILVNQVTSYEVAVFLAFPVALTVAFALNRNYVFSGSRGSPAAQYLKFALINVLALAQVWLISVGLARFLFPAMSFAWHADTVAHVIGVGSPIVTSFLAYKYFVFPQAGHPMPQPMQAPSGHPDGKLPGRELNRCRRIMGRPMSRAASPLPSRWHLTAAVAAVAAIGYLLALFAVGANGGIMGRLSEVAIVLPVVIVGTIIACGLRAMRWLWLLSLRGHVVPTVEGLLGYLTGLAFTATPGKVGELVRVRYFGRLGVPHEQTIACFVFERVLDLLVLLSFASLLLGEKVGLSVATGFVAIILSVVISIAWFPGLRRRIQRTLRASGLRRMARIFRIAFRGIEQTRQFLPPARLAPALLLGVLAWGVQCMGYALALLQLSIALPFSTLFAVSPAAMLVGAASMLPGGVGTTEGATVALLLKFGTAVDTAVVGAIGIRLGSIWFSTIIGFMAVLYLEWRTAFKAWPERPVDRRHSMM